MTDIEILNALGPVIALLFLGVAVTVERAGLPRDRKVAQWSQAAPH